MITDQLAIVSDHSTSTNPYFGPSFGPDGFRLSHLTDPGKNSFDKGSTNDGEDSPTALVPKDGGSKDTPTPQLSFRDVKSHSTAVQKIFVCFRRDLRVSLTDPVLYVARIIVCCVQSYIFALLWWEGRDYEVKFAMNRMWPFAMNISSSSLPCLVTVFFFERAHRVVKTDVRNGLYPASAFAGSAILLSFPGLLLMAVFSCIGSMYGLANFQWSAAHIGVLGCFLILLIFDSIARVCSLLPNMLLGMMVFVQSWFSSFLFCGFMIGEEDVGMPSNMLGKKLLLGMISSARWCSCKRGSRLSDP